MIWGLGVGVATAQPPVTAPVKPEAQRGTTIVPDDFLRRWDPITIFFSRDRGPATGGVVDDPDSIFQLSPKHPGEVRWLDARTLQFKPADPWPALERFAVRAGGERRTLVTLMAPPEATRPEAKSEGAPDLRDLTLTYAEPVNPAALARSLSVELRPLPGVDGRGASWLDLDDFEVKVLERSGRDERSSYVVTFPEPLPQGHRVLVHQQLSLEAIDGRPSGLVTVLELTTAEPFRVTALGCGTATYPITAGGVRYGPEQAIRCDEGATEARLELSAEIAELGPVLGRNLVRLSPSVDGLSYAVAGKTVAVRGDFRRDVPYRLALAPAALEDRRGRRLQVDGDSEVWIYFPSRPSFLSWARGHGLVERLGPHSLPVTGRGDQRMDLRIHAVDPLDRNFWPFPEAPVAVEEWRRPPGPGEMPEAFSELYRWQTGDELAGRLRALGSPTVSTLLDLPLEGKIGARFGLDLEAPLADAFGEGRPGSYVAGLRRLDGSKTRSFMHLQVTDLSLTTFEEARRVIFAVTSLATGGSVAGARVTVEGAVRDRSHSGEWRQLWTGLTDEQGWVTWQVPGWRRNRTVAVRRLVVEKDDDHLVLDASRPPRHFKDGGFHDPQTTWLQWTHEKLEWRGEQARQLGHLFTERPVYRPEEPVHLAGFLRWREGGRLRPITRPGYLVIEGPGGREWREEIRPSASGSFYFRFADEESPAGVYRAHFTPKGSREKLGGVTFRKEAYRLPRFEVLLSGPEGGGPATLDRPFDVELAATYYAGGRVSRRPVRWRVTQFPYTWRPQARDGFIYASDGRYSQTERFESTPALDREETTDADGGAVLRLDPSIEPTAQPRTYVVEATVTGTDDQTVTATRRVVALPAFLLALKAPRFLEPGAELVPEILVIGPDDEPLAGQEVTVRLLHRQWHSHLRASDFSDGVARYVTDVVDEPISETEIVSGAGAMTVPLELGEPGVYVVELEARDRLGRTQVVAVDLYAASGGEEPVSWERPSSQIFEVASDQASYRPGENARLVLRSPFQSAHAVVVVEAPEGNRYHQLEVKGGEGTFELPIEGHFSPRLPVHVVLMRGRVPGTSPRPRGAMDLGKPATLAATRWLEVEPVDLRLGVELEHAAESMPGRTLDVTVRLTTPDGAPAAGELTLWLVDRAVLALGTEQRLDPLPDFLTAAASHLEVRDTRDLVFGDLPFVEIPGGGVGAAEKGVLDRQTVRRNFEPVPFFEAGIEVGPDGEVTVPVELPDNLTDFAVRAKATSGAQRFGAAKGRLSVRLPVIVQPALPRFVRAGDRFEAVAVGRVVSGQGGAGRAEVRVQGLELATEASRDLTWSPETPERLSFEVAVPTPELGSDGRPSRRSVSVTVGVERLSDQAGDAFEVSLPLVDDRRPVVDRQLVDLAPGERFEWPAVEEAVRPGTLGRELLVAGRPALVRMAAGLDALVEYPFGCTEQRVSRARAQLAMSGFREVLAMPPAEEMRRGVEETFEWISQSTDEDGLVAFWPGARGYVSLTAWVAGFLAEAEKQGFEVPGRVREPIERALNQALRSDYSGFIDGAAWSERVMALEALTHLGRLDAAYGAELGRKADFLTTEDLARLLLALDAGGEGTSRPRLLERLFESVIFQQFQGQTVYAGLQNKGLGNPLILPSETRTLAAMTRALARLARQDRRFEPLVDALVRLGRGDGWGTTRADAAALLALSELVEPGSDTSPRRTLSIEGAGEGVELAVGDGPPAALWRGAEAGQLVLTASGDEAAPPLVVRAETRYVPAGDGSTVTSARQGFVVERRWLIQEAGTPGAPPRQVPIDEPTELSLPMAGVVEEHVRVVNSEERHFVAVVVPLAAGLEALNPHLATAPPEATPSGSLTLEPTYADFRDDHVAFYYDTLPRGSFDFYFRTRASIFGSFSQPPARAEMMYDQAVFGRSAGARVDVVATEDGGSGGR